MTVERSPRYSSIQFHVVYDDGEGYMTANVVNISRTGVFLETAMPLAPGSRVRMSPLLPDSAGLFELDGEVVRAEEYDPERGAERPAGMGVRFVDVSEEQVTQLHSLLESAATR